MVFPNYTFIDLFCGIGGFRHALEKKGMQCVFSSEINEKSQEIYLKSEKHFLIKLNSKNQSMSHVTHKISHFLHYPATKLGTIYGSRKTRYLPVIRVNPRDLYGNSPFLGALKSTLHWIAFMNTQLFSFHTFSCYHCQSLASIYFSSKYDIFLLPSLYCPYFFYF